MPDTAVGGELLGLRAVLEEKHAFAQKFAATKRIFCSGKKTENKECSNLGLSVVTIVVKTWQIAGSF